MATSLDDKALKALKERFGRDAAVDKFGIFSVTTVRGVIRTCGVIRYEQSTCTYFLLTCDPDLDGQKCMSHLHDKFKTKYSWQLYLDYVSLGDGVELESWWVDTEPTEQTPMSIPGAPAVVRPPESRLRLLLV